MAEYFPLLERAIAGLGESTPESRQAIYERARTALLGQLRKMDPPVPEEDIQRENAALDEAAQRVEAKFRAPAPAASSPVVPPAPPREPPPSPVASKPTTSPAREADPSPTPSPSPAAPSPAAPIIEPPVRQTVRPTIQVEPSARAPVQGRDPAPAVSLPPGRELPPSGRPPANGAPPAPRGGRLRPKIEPEVGPPAPPASSPERAARPASDGPPKVPEAAGSREESGGSPDSRTLPPAATLPVADGARTAREEADATSGPRTDRRAGARPLAPVAAEVSSRRGPVFYVLLALALLVAAGIAVAAFRLRDRPEQITARRNPAPAGETSEPGKLAGRAEGTAGTGAPAAPTPAPSSSGTPTTADSQQQTGASSGGTGAEQPSSAQTSTAAPNAAAPAASSANAPIGVAQRAGLLVDAPEDPQKVKTYSGSVVWRSDSVSAGQGQPLSTAVRADVDIPDAKLTMSTVIKKNTEPQFPASHTLEFHFAEEPGNTLGPVKQINVPEMRKDDNAPTGDPLTGVPVAITQDYFLVGLSRGSSEGSNLEMLQQRNWVDVSILFASGKVAKITFEKGPTGQHALDDAIKAWQ